MKGTILRAAVAAAIFCSAAGAGAAIGSTTVPSARQFPRAGRDPLVPPQALYTGQDLPPIEVTLIGVDSRQPGRPLAVIRMDSRPPVRKVVRPGERIGDYRILRIEPHRVRISVPGLGTSTVVDLTVRDSTQAQR